MPAASIIGSPAAGRRPNVPSTRTSCSPSPASISPADWNSYALVTWWRIALLDRRPVVEPLQQQLLLVAREVARDRHVVWLGLGAPQRQRQHRRDRLDLRRVVQVDEPERL